MIALARKYRPRRFADLLVQDHVAAALRGAVAKQRVGHGYLLTGPRGVGKTTAARMLAMALNCECPDADHPGEPCGDCDTCQRIWAGSANLDVVEIDAASNRSVDDARDLRERAMYAASDENRYKVYIIDEAHMLTREAWNALLKILEEPPPRVVFVFATTEPQKIANMAAPVLSRLQRFDFKRIGASAIRGRLQEVLSQEGLTADEDALALIARYADGGMRDALSILDQVLSLSDGPLQADRVREALGLIGEETYGRVLRAVSDHDAARIFPIVDEVVGSGADLVEFMNGLAEMLRAVLMSQTGARAEGLTAVAREAVEASAERLVPGDVLRMLGLLADAETAIRRSANGRLVVETLLLRWALMDRTVDLEAVLAGAPPGPVTGQAAARPFAERDDPAPRQASAPVRSAAPATARAAAEPTGLPPLVDELTVEALTAAWPDVAARGRQASPLAGAVLESLEPAAVEGDTVRLRVLSDDGHMAEGARRHQKTIESVIAEAVGRAVRVELGEAAPQVAVNDRPKRLSAKDLREERLKELRGIDPALDAAAEALDLEIVD